MSRTVSFNKNVIGHYSMDPDVKEEWLIALRSGEYNQGKHNLKPAENTYCCLGVLCLIYGRHQEHFIDFHKREEDGAWAFDVPEAKPRSHSVLPHDEIYKWAGIIHPGDDNLLASVKNTSGETIDMHCRTAAGLLSTLNDSVGYSFNEIADYIETYL